MNKIIIAIDGHAGCGKSTTAKALAKSLNYIYVDSGAMYRAVTLYFLQNQIDWTDKEEIEKALPKIDLSFSNSKNEICLNGKNVEDEIRKMEVAEKVSDVSKYAEVRRFLVAQQAKLGENKGIVMDGRDIGTVVFPEAELKIFMTASLEVRAERRKKELAKSGNEIELQDIIENMKSRDQIDATRRESPLRKADDAIVVDTSNLSFDEQVEKILNYAEITIQRKSLD